MAQNRSNAQVGDMSSDRYRDLRSLAGTFYGAALLGFVLFGIVSLTGHVHGVQVWGWSQPAVTTGSSLGLLGIVPADRRQPLRRGLSRRQVLAAASVSLGLVSAGCLDDGSDGSTPPPSSEGNGSRQEDGEMDESTMIYRDGEILQVTVDEAGQATPSPVRVAAGATLALTLINEGTDSHGIAGEQVGITETVVDPGTSESTTWAVAAQPGSYTASCPVHETGLLDVEIVPVDASGGCPSG